MSKSFDPKIHAEHIGLGFVALLKWTAVQHNRAGFILL